MAHKVITKSVLKLDSRELRYCYNSSFRSAGDLSEWLYQGRHWVEYEDTQVILSSEDDFLLGWGIRRPNGDVGFWTRREARGKGVGLAMVKKAAKLGDIIVHPHDEPSRALFRKAGRYVNGRFNVVDSDSVYLHSLNKEYQGLGRRTELLLDSQLWGEHLLKIQPKE